MDDKNLDQLLSSQDSLKDENFTKNVMTSLPHPLSKKKREYILFGSLFCGVIMALFLLPSDLLFAKLFSQSFIGDPTSIAITAAFTICTLAFGYSVVSAASDEL